MSRRRRVGTGRRLGLTLATVACALMAAPAPVDAATLEKAGWWWRAQPSGLPAPLPTPPVVGEGQLLVQGGPEGPTAVAALRWQLGADEAGPVLMLTPAEGSQVPESAVIFACRASEEWQETSAGRWDDRPPADCSEAARGAVADGTVTFDLAALVEDGVLDIVVFPGVDPAVPAGANGSTFSLTFDEPGPSAVRTSSAPPEDDFVPDDDFVGGTTIDPGPLSGATIVPLPEAPAPQAAPAYEQPARTPLGNVAPTTSSGSVAPEDGPQPTRGIAMALLVAGVLFAGYAAFGRAGDDDADIVPAHP